MSLSEIEKYHLERINKPSFRISLSSNMVEAKRKFSVFEKLQHQAGVSAQILNRKPRGKIEGWSKESRIRLLKLINSINGEGYKKYMVTLTYGENYPDWETSKGHLDYFSKNFLSRIIPNYGIGKWFAVWRLEFQLRNAPHYHILLYTDIPFNEYDFKEKAARFWLDCVGEYFGDPRYGVDIKECWIDYVGYIAGHSLKADQIRAWCAGRWWGKWNKKHLDATSIHEVEDLDEKQFYRFVRVIRKYKTKKIIDQIRRRKKEGKGSANKIKLHPSKWGISSVMPLKDMYSVLDWVKTTAI